MAFVGVDEVLEVLEEVTARSCAEAAGVELPRPFPRFSYQETMDRYGSDRPDTRIRLELVDLSDAFRESEFRAIRGAVEGGGIVKCLPVHQAEELSRGEIDRLESFVCKELGARGLAWIRITSRPVCTWPLTVRRLLTSSDSRTSAPMESCHSPPALACSTMPLACPLVESTSPSTSASRSRPWATTALANCSASTTSSWA